MDESLNHLHLIQTLDLDDIFISYLQWDRHGEHLAVGDKNGYIWIFKCIKQPLCSCKYPSRDPLTSLEFLFKFQSHVPEFDILRSMEIEEGINSICWMDHYYKFTFLSSNDSMIKLWKIHDERHVRLDNLNRDLKNIDRSSLFLPSFTTVSSSKIAKLRCSYNSDIVHKYHINSLSSNCDGETFISSDDLAICLWNLNYDNKIMNIFEIPPPSEQLTEVITHSSFHPSSCNLLIYSSSSGYVRLNDLRDSASLRLDRPSLSLCSQYSSSEKNEYYFHMLNAISDTSFSPDGEYFLKIFYFLIGFYVYARNYMNTLLWDIRKNSNKPLKIFPTQTYLRIYYHTIEMINHLIGPILHQLYQSDHIFDRFDISVSNNGCRCVSGTYQNCFVICDTVSGKSSLFECKSNDSNTQIETKINEPTKFFSESNLCSLDLEQRVHLSCFHPSLPILLTASKSKIFLYQFL